MAESTQSPTTTPLPTLVFLQALPTSSPMDKPIAPESAGKSSAKPPIFSLPKLLFEIRDLNHEGAAEFLTAVLTTKALATAVQSVLTLLYETPNSPVTTVPTTRSVTLILRSMGGVAYTTGKEIDSDHKEIHFSLDYIHGIDPSRKDHEIMGVLTHEMVHCYQYDAYGTCPGGLIEGIADWVRLNSDLSPPHWKKEASGNWDAGYQHTGYFLEYLEQRFGKGTVRRINEKLRIQKYHEKAFWTEVVGRPVEQLWADYQESLKKEEEQAAEDECVIVEKGDAIATTTTEDATPSDV